MDILIVGAGNVGGALGRAWSAVGHRIHYAVPDPDNKKYHALPSTSIHTLDKRPSSDVVVLATPFAAAEFILRSLGDLKQAVLIDCTNPLEMTPEGLRLTIGFHQSGGEMIAKWATGARVVKSMNQTGAENMDSATSYRGKPVMFLAGDDAAAKDVVTMLITEIGFEPIDSGPLTQARLLEPLAMLWIDLAFKRGQGRDFAFSLLRKH